MRMPNKYMACRYFLIFFAILMQVGLNRSMGQVIIKDSLTLSPIDTINKGWKSIGAGHNRNAHDVQSLYFECGGPVTLTNFQSSYYQIISLPTQEVLAQNINPGQTVSLGNIPAGTSLSLGYVYSDEDNRIGDFSMWGQPGLPSIGAYLDSAHFYQDVYYYAFTLELGIGDSSSCLDLRPPSGPPNAPQPVVAPADTHFTFFLWRNVRAQRDSLWFYTQHNGYVDSLFLDSAVAWNSTRFDLGSAHAEDTVNFFLRSVIKGVKGEKMYPRVTYHLVDPEGPWDYSNWTIDFENWINTDFTDYRGVLYMKPQRYRITFAKGIASPGDTVRFHVDVIGNADQDIDSQIYLNLLTDRSFATIVDTLGNDFGPDPLSGQGYLDSSQVRDGFAVAISKTAPPGSKILLQVMSDWDDIYGGRENLDVSSSILLGQTKYYQTK